METNKNGSHVEGCKCVGCWSGPHRFSILRVIVALVILAIVFCAGLKIGEVGGNEGRYGDHGKWHMYNYGQEGYMMRGQYAPQMMTPPTQGVPAVVPAATSTR